MEIVLVPFCGDVPTTSLNAYQYASCVGDLICEQLLTQETSLCLQEKPIDFWRGQETLRGVCPPFARQHPYIFPCFEIRNFATSFFLGLCRTKAIAIHRIVILLFFTHPPLPGFGIRQNFGSLKTLQFYPPM